MSERDAIVAVTEADRKAYLSLNMLPELDAADVRAGRWDKVAGLQAFARHRAAHAGEVERLREALVWYGEQARLARLIHSEGDAGRYALADDGGKRARQALEASR